MSALVKREAAVVQVDQLQHLTFTLGGEMFAIGILSVKEIIEYGSLTVVPMMPDCIRGVINLRGAVVPVVDLRCRFSHQATEITRRSCIVIIEVEASEVDGDQDGGKQDVGVIVDAVSEVLEIHPNEIEPSPAFGAKIRTDYIQGMGKVDGRFVIILNVHRVLSLDDLAVVVQAATQPASLALQEATV